MRNSILLVHAPTDDWIELFRGAPMSLLYAAAVLYRALGEGRYPGFSQQDMVLYDAALDHTGEPAAAVRQLRQELVARQPAIVCIGATTPAYFWALELARAVKAWRPDCPVILGGPHEDECGACGPSGSISAHGDIVDFSIQGDGEYLLELVFRLLYENKFSVEKAKEVLESCPDAIAQCEGFGAVSFRRNGRVITLATTPQYQPGLALRKLKPLSLGRLPFPPRALLEERHHYLFDIFRRGDGRLKKTAQMMTHRGCPYSCEFCTERGSYVDRPLEHVVQEIEHLHREGFEAIFFDDSTFHVYRHLPDLLDYLAANRHRLGLEFGCLTRVDSIVKARGKLPLERFRDAGFSYMYLGIEHYDDRVLREMRKGYDTRTIDRCIELFEQAGLRMGVSLLFGFESETESSRRATLALVARSEPIILANLSILAYHPASPELARQRPEAMPAWDGPPPNREPEWDLFEEGRWYHPPHINLDYVRRLHALVWEVDQQSGGRLIPKLRRKGALLSPDELTTGLPGNASPARWRLP